MKTMTTPVLDALKRPITVDDTVFYNGCLYMVTGFATKDKRIKLNHRSGSRLMADKLRWPEQVMIVDPVVVSHYLLTKDAE